MIYTDLETLLPLAAAKHGLGLWSQESDPAIDAQVEAYRAASLAWLRATTGRHPLQAEGSAEVHLPYGDEPVCVWAPDGRVTEVRHWASATSATADPDETISTVGRSYEDGIGELHVWPASEWPQDMGNRRRAVLALQFTWDVTDEELGTIRAAALLYQRSLFMESEKQAKTGRMVLQAAGLRRPWLRGLR